MSKTSSIELLAAEHADAIQALVSDPAIAATTRIPYPYPENGARDFIAAQLKERAEGRSYAFAIKERGEIVGACGLHGIEGLQAMDLGYWVGRPYWGQGFATVGVHLVLEFAFRNLRLESVHAKVLETNAASRRVLEKNGFLLLGVQPHADPLLKRPDEPVAIYRITGARWRELRDAPALASLHPDLKEILLAELTAGNEIVETGGGWPDRESVFIRLRDPFQPRYAPLPPGVAYLELNDPRWWNAEYHTLQPRHILAH